MVNAVCALAVVAMIGAVALPQEQLTEAERAQYQRVYKLLDEIERVSAGQWIGRLRGSAMKAEARQLKLPPQVLSAYEELREAAIASQQLPDAEREKFRKLLADDLKLKYEYCSVHPLSMTAIIDVTVNTLMPGDGPRQEANQWNVVYLSAVMAANPDRQGTPFPGFSSPSHMQLAPGNYVVWAEHPADSKRRGPRKEIRVGDPKQPLDARVIADILAGK